MMRSSKKQASPRRDAISAFRGAGKRRYTSDKLALDRKIEREEEEERDRRSVVKK